MKHENQEDRKKKKTMPDSRGINPHAPPER